MINIKFNFDERKFKDKIEKVAYEATKKKIEEKVRKALTATERSQIKIKIKGQKLNDLRFEFEGPEEIVAKIKKVL